MHFGEDGPYRQAFPLPGSPTMAAGCKTASYLPKTNPRRYRQNCQRWGHTGAWPRTTVAGGDSSYKAVSLGFKTLVCLFVAGQPRAWKKNINVILSPMSHRSARAEIPRSSRHRARGGWGRARGTPKAAHPSSCCLPGPAPMPSPSPQLGTPVAQGHQWHRDNFLRPGRRHRNLHLYLHFLIAPAGFLGQRLPLVSMAGFVRTPRTEGGTKGPQWTCHSPASKAAGGAGQGHRGRGHRSLPPPPSTGADTGSPPGRGRGSKHSRDTDGFGTARAVVGTRCWQCSSTEEPSLNHHRPEVAATARPAEVVQEPDPDVPPVLASRYFQPAFHPAGVGFFPLPTS